MYISVLLIKKEFNIVLQHSEHEKQLSACIYFCVYPVFRSKDIINKKKVFKSEKLGKKRCKGG